MLKKKNPLKNLFECDNCEFVDGKYFFENCRIKTILRDPTLQCLKIKKFDRIIWDINSMTLMMFIDDKNVYSTYLNVDYDIKSIQNETDTFSKNNEFREEMDNTIKSMKINGLCGVSCLELPDDKIVYLLGEKHMEHRKCSNTSNAAWVYVYGHVLANPKWKYTIDFLLEQDVHEIVQRKSNNKRIQEKLERLNIKKLRYVMSDLCKYRTKGYSSDSDLLSRKVNVHVRPQKNDIRGILYNIQTLYKALEQIKKKMMKNNVSDDAYVLSKNFIHGLNEFMVVKNLEEFYIKFAWIREITMHISTQNKKMFDRMVQVEYMRRIKIFYRAQNFFDKFDVYVETTVLLNDLYTIAYILIPDVHRIVVYSGLYHTNNVETLLTKYFQFRILWNSIDMKDIYEENQNECCFDFQTSISS